MAITELDKSLNNIGDLLETINEINADIGDVNLLETDSKVIVESINELKDTMLSSGYVTIDNAQNVLGIKSFLGYLKTDFVYEYTTGAGVKFPNGVKSNSLLEYTPGTGITIETVLVKNGGVTTVGTAPLVINNGTDRITYNENSSTDLTFRHNNKLVSGNIKTSATGASSIINLKGNGDTNGEFEVLVSSDNTSAAVDTTITKWTSLKVNYNIMTFDPSSITNHCYFDIKGNNGYDVYLDLKQGTSNRSVLRYNNTDTRTEINHYGEESSIQSSLYFTNTYLEATKLFKNSIGLSTDTISEYTSTTGVTIDSVLLKDGTVKTTELLSDTDVTVSLDKNNDSTGSKFKITINNSTDLLELNESTSLKIMNANGGSLLKLVDSSAASSTAANPYIELQYSNTPGGSITGLGNLGYKSTANTIMTLENTVGNIEINSTGTTSIDDVVIDGGDITATSITFGDHVVSQFLVDTWTPTFSNGITVSTIHRANISVTHNIVYFSVSVTISAHSSTGVNGYMVLPYDAQFSVETGSWMETSGTGEMGGNTYTVAQSGRNFTIAGDNKLYFKANDYSDINVTAWSDGIIQLTGSYVREIV